MIEEERADGPQPGDGGTDVRVEAGQGEVPANGLERGEGAGSAGRRRRRGCGCLLRGPIYLFVLGLLLATGAYFWLQSDGAHERATRLLGARLGEYFGRDIEVGGVRWTLFPLTVEVEDLVIPGPEPGAPAFARVPELRLDLRLENWLRPGQAVLDVERIHLQGPEVYIEVREDGTNNLPRFGRDEEGRRRVEIRLGAITVREGRFRFNELEVPLDFRASSVFARLQGEQVEGGGIELEGLVVAQEAEVILPEGKPYALSFSARARFGPRRIDFHKVLVRGPDLQARASGSLLVPSDERLLELDVSALGRVALASHLGYLEPHEPPAEGPVRFEGGLVWRPEGWSVQGRLSSSRLTLADRVLSDVDGTLRVRPETLRYEIERASYAGGGVSGVITGDLQAHPRTFEVDLAVDRLDLAEVIADQGIPLEGVAGRISGEVSYRFDTDQPEEGSGWADLSLAAARQAPLTGGLELTGQVPLELDRGTIRSGAIRLVSSSGAQVLRSEGSYDLSARAGSFRWHLSTSDVGELSVFVPVEEETPPVWLPTSGRGEVEGVLHLRPDDFSVEATFDLAAVEAPGLAAERLEGSVTASALGLRGLRLQAASSGGALMVGGSIPFEEGEGRVPFELTVDAASWPGDERLAAWLPFALPVTGPVSGRLELAGSPEALRGRAELSIEPAEVAGFEVDVLLAELLFDPDRLVVERVVARSPAGDLTARGALDFASGALDFRIEAPSLDLEEEPFATALAADVAGSLSLEADIEGTLELPRARATLVSRGLTVAGRSLTPEGAPEGSTEDVRQARLEIVWDGQRLEAEGGVAGLLALDGGGLLSTERADLRLRLASTRVGALARLAAPQVPEDFGGELEGELVVAGAFADLESLLVRLELSDLTLRYEDRALRNVEPVVVRFTGDGVAVDSFYVEEPATGSEIFAQGTLGLGGDGPLDFRLQGSISTEWVELFVPTVSMEGTFDVLATVRGTVGEPRLNGQGEIRDGSLAVDGLPQSLEDLTAVVLFYPDQVVLDHLQARAGGGAVRASGRVRLYGPGGLDYSLQATLSDVTLRYPEGFWLRADAALALVSTPDGRLLRGTVELDRAYYVKDVEVGVLQLLRRALRAQRLEVAETGELEASTQLAVSIRAPGTVRVRNNLADLRGSADLTLRGSLARPVLFGEVELERGGTLVYAENDFEVERLRLTFASPTRIDPIIDLVAFTEVRSYEVTLNLSGRVDVLRVQVSSDPPLSDLDIVALLTTGQPPGEGVGIPGIAEVETFSAGAAERLLYGQAATAVSQRLETLFGFDTFRISPVAREAGGAIGGVGVTVGKRISKDVFVTYTDLPSDTEGSLLQVEWQIDENLTLVFTAVGDDAYRVDARWDRRF
ncbi:MAG TPA: translocation/assembly module TamB domain-containing protein [Thermoanaerobaculia bacterium]|nr:translocation/assembly module TamB domain-containing protein [Thermoanaerobaculia bacterium]